MLQKKITFDSFIRGILSGIVIIGILYLVNRLSGVSVSYTHLDVYKRQVYNFGLTVKF